MAEIKAEVKTILVNYACDKCSQNPNPGCILNRTGRNVYLSDPMKFEYKCPSCNELFWLDEAYPKVEYEYLNNGD